MFLSLIANPCRLGIIIPRLMFPVEKNENSCLLKFDINIKIVWNHEQIKDFKPVFEWALQTFRSILFGEDFHKKSFICQMNFN